MIIFFIFLFYCLLPIYLLIYHPLNLYLWHHPTLSSANLISLTASSSCIWLTCFFLTLLLLLWWLPLYLWHHPHLPFLLWHHNHLLLPPPPFYPCLLLVASFICLFLPQHQHIVLHHHHCMMTQKDQDACSLVAMFSTNLNECSKKLLKWLIICIISNFVPLFERIRSKGRNEVTK